jgi:dipeptidyl-peptidase-4
MNRLQPLRLVLGLVLAACLFSPLALGQGSAQDYQRAGELSSRTRGQVRNLNLRAQWDDTGRYVWYMHEDAQGKGEHVLVDAKTGVKTALPPHPELIEAVEAVADDEQHRGDPTIGFDGQGFYLYFVQSGTTWRYDLESGRAKVSTLSEASCLLVAPASEFVRSRDAGGRTDLRIVNELDERLTVHWIDRGGVLIEYGQVEQGETWSTSTYAGHAWALVSPNGETRAVFVADADKQIGLVIPSTPQPRSQTREKAPRAEPPAADVFFQDHNAWLRRADSGEQLQLTTDGTREHGYGNRPTWSPDRSKVVILRTLEGDERKVHYVESSPRDQLQPKLHSYNYLKPGDAIDLQKPHLFDVASAQEIEVPDDLFLNPYSIRQLRWDDDGERFTFLYNERGHQALRIVAVDGNTGQTTAIVDETSATFIDYSQKTYRHDVNATDELLWMSERDGWNHLYLFDAKTGKVKNQVTSGEWVVRGVDRVDDQLRQIWFRAGGIHPAQDPYHIHFARINFDGTGLTLLTEGDGTHEVTYSPTGEYFIDRYSRVDLAPVVELRRVDDGGLVCELDRADDAAVRAKGWSPPERFVAKGRDGKTDIFGIIHRPSNYDPGAKYPVIESIYAGPHGAFVPKSFRSHYQQSELAELGFIVVQIDGMGTNFRSRAFHDVCWKNLGDSGFPDRILWMQAAAKKDPAMDLTRVGIYGGSAGGQSSTRALLAFGDFYDVAVSDCGCHDNRMDKIWWNEAWMGWPIGPHYKEQSNVTQAHNLIGKLMLTVGEMDENVDPASTMQVVDALIRADKDFDLIVFPGGGHGAGGSTYGVRRRRDFFVRHLLGVEPRWE